MDIRSTILSRCSATASLAPLKIQTERVLGIYDAIRAEHSKVAADPNLSSIGRQDALRKFVERQLAPELRRTSAAIKRARTTLEERRQLLRTPPTPEKADAAAAVVRSDLRQMIRAMPQGKKVKILLDPDVDPTLLAAVLEAPDMASGIDGLTFKMNDREQSLRGWAKDVYAQKMHSHALAALDEADEAVTLLSSAYDVTRNTVRSATELHESVFEKFIDGAVGADRAARIDDQVRIEMQGVAG